MSSTDITKTAKPVTATDLNKWVLTTLAAGRVEFPNRIDSTSANAMRRCLRAGLVEIVGTNLRLTATGIDACNWQAQKTRNSRVPTLAITTI